MNILILTGRFCMGHWSASKSLAQQIVDAYPGARVHIEDLMDYAMPELSGAVYKGYNLLVTCGPALFNAYYKMKENTPAHLHFAGHFVEKLTELLEAERPDAVIATHPFCAQVVSRYKEVTGKKLPLITCVTDISAHSEWICQGTDCYLVGSGQVRDKLMDKGVDRDRICVTGIPVRAEFLSARPRPVQIRGKEEPRQLLIMGGGLGLMPRKDSFYEALNALPGVHTTIITGRNQKLFERLSGKYENIEVVGYTDRVYEYMSRSHLLLTKPGGITTFEALFSQLPILAWEPFWEQERKNARFLVDQGIGRVAEKESSRCLRAIRALIYDDQALDQMAANMGRLKEMLSQERLCDIVAATARTSEVCA